MLKKMVISSMYIQVFSLEVSSSFWFPTNLNCVSELLIFSSVHDALWQQKHKQNSEKQKKKKRGVEGPTLTQLHLGNYNKMQ